jgi:hypothetical protein
MFTDRPPTKPALLAAFRESDQRGSLEVPEDDRLIIPAGSVEAAMKVGDRTAVRRSCSDFLVRASDFYGVSQPVGTCARVAPAPGPRGRLGY